MGNLNYDRVETERRESHLGLCPIAAGVKGGQGLLCLIDSNGRYKPASAVACLGVTAPAAGLQRYDNTSGGEGALVMSIYTEGKFPFDNDEDNPVAVGDKRKPVFAVDNHTVSLQPFAASGIRAFVGYVATEELEGDQVIVDVQPYNLPTPAQMGDYVQAPLQTLQAATALVINQFQGQYQVESNSGDVTLTAALPAGYHGQTLTIEGTSDSKRIIVSSAISNLKLAGGASALLGANSFITVEYNGTYWCEKARSLNS